MTLPNQNIPAYAIRLSRTRVTKLLLVVVVVLLADHIMLQTFHYRWGRGHWLLKDLFDVDLEENIPTWYSSASLMFTAGLLYAIASRSREDEDRFALHWWGLACGFLVLSIDEIAGMHEGVNTVIDIPWTIPGAVLVTVVLLLYLKFLLCLKPKTRWGFLLAGTLFVGGAVGVEHATDWYLDKYDIDTLGYNLLTALEEGLEMLGVVVMIHTLLGHMETDGIVSVGLTVADD